MKSDGTLLRAEYIETSPKLAKVDILHSTVVVVGLSWRTTVVRFCKYFFSERRGHGSIIFLSTAL